MRTITQIIWLACLACFVLFILLGKPADAQMMFGSAPPTTAVSVPTGGLMFTQQVCVDGVCYQDMHPLSSPLRFDLYPALTFGTVAAAPVSNMQTVVRTVTAPVQVVYVERRVQYRAQRQRLTSWRFGDMFRRARSNRAARWGAWRMNRGYRMGGGMSHSSHDMGHDSHSMGSHDMNHSGSMAMTSAPMTMN